MDLVEGGDVRRLFSDAELLDLAGAEEEHEKRWATNSAHKPGGKEKDGLVSRGPVGSGAGGGRPRENRADEARGSGESDQGVPGAPRIGGKDQARTNTVCITYVCVQVSSCRSLCNTKYPSRPPCLSTLSLKPICFQHPSRQKNKAIFLFINFPRVWNKQYLFGMPNNAHSKRKQRPTTGSHQHWLLRKNTFFHEPDPTVTFLAESRYCGGRAGPAVGSTSFIAA